jgi:putative hydrolase of the HAD superfamily
VVTQPKVKHILFDADGVLQQLPGGWHDAVRPFLGDHTDAFLRRTWNEELPMLSGQGDYLPLLEAALRDYGCDEEVDVVYRAVWQRIDLVDASFELVHELKAAGFGVHLGTNQERYRGGFMRSALGYDEVFDVSCYSYDVGAMKPDPAFFHEALRRINAPAAEVLFIDDSLPNVESARAVGLRAEHWHFDEGHEVLRGHLQAHRVQV